MVAFIQDEAKEMSDFHGVGLTSLDNMYWPELIHRLSEIGYEHKRIRLAG